MTPSTTQAPARDWLTTSVETISLGQAPSGSYIASPTFEQYAFGWLRDGAYCAMAMDAAGQHASARDFHEWVIGVVHRHSADISRVMAQHHAGAAPDAAMLLPTRYHLDGRSETVEGEDAWPNFQLDGYGTWLFSFARHRAEDDLSPRERSAVRLVADYLASTWRLPCYDYWEEYGDRRHTSTLASIAAGFDAAAALLDEPVWAELSREVVREIGDLCTDGQRFTKGVDDPRVDASLLALSTPFDLVAIDDPRMLATVRAIDDDLTSPSGGVRRYVGDEYYGGSPWLLLTAWRGWHARRTGDVETYERAREWVRESSGDDRLMPEQRVDEPQIPEMVSVWERRWGRAADPLLWSHAMYLLMELAGGKETE